MLHTSRCKLHKAAWMALVCAGSARRSAFFRYQQNNRRACEAPSEPGMAILTSRICSAQQALHPPATDDAGLYPHAVRPQSRKNIFQYSVWNGDLSQALNRDSAAIQAILLDMSVGGVRISHAGGRPARSSHGASRGGRRASVTGADALPGWGCHTQGRCDSFKLTFAHSRLLIG